MAVDKLFQMLDDAADGAFVVDENQRIIFWNRAAQEISGYMRHEALDRPCFEVIAGRDDQDDEFCNCYCPVFAMVAKGKGVNNFDTYMLTKSGQRRWINVSILTLPPANGNAPPLLIHLFRDVTEKKKNEAFIHQVLDATEQLQSVNSFQTNHTTSAAVPAKDLTGRECEILSLLAQGLNTRDMAHTLSISPSTVRNHIQNILHKFQVHSRLEAVTYALERGLVA